MTETDGSYAEVWLKRNIDGTYELRAHPTQYPRLASWPEYRNSPATLADDGRAIKLALPAGWCTVVIDEHMPKPTNTP